MLCLFDEIVGRYDKHQLKKENKIEILLIGRESQGFEKASIVISFFLMLNTNREFDIFSKAKVH